MCKGNPLGFVEAKVTHRTALQEYKSPDTARWLDEHAVEVGVGVGLMGLAIGYEVGHWILFKKE